MELFKENTLNYAKAFDYLRISFDESLNIYNQAQFEKRELDHHIEPKGIFLDVSFTIKGDIEAEIQNTLYFESDQQKEALSSLCIESLNILLGKAITNTDNDFNVNLNLSTPALGKNKNSSRTKPLKYTLYTNLGEIDCLIDINILRSYVR